MTTFEIRLLARTTIAILLIVALSALGSCRRGVQVDQYHYPDQERLDVEHWKVPHIAARPETRTERGANGHLF